MSKIDDGGPAFPVPTISGPDLSVDYPPYVRGMTLRDWFAGQVQFAPDEPSVFRFTFAPGVDLRDVESTLQLSILAAEGLFGEASVRMDASYLADAPRSVIVVDGSTAVGDAIVRIYTGFLTREIGADAFSVRRMSAPRQASSAAVLDAIIRDARGGGA